ncbi:MAG: hypothetical protein AAGD96_20290, partial [Chloroflexota bacterium]
YGGLFDNSLLDFSNLATKSENLQKIAHQTNFNITTPQTTPIEYAGEDTLLYETTVLPFVFEASIGSSVIVNNGGDLTVNNFGSVEDCSFFSYQADENHTFGAEKISPAGIWEDSPENIIFKIESAPAAGQINLNGTVQVSEDSEFTLKTLLLGGGEINYVAPDNTESSDKIVLRTNGIVRLTNANGDSYHPSISAGGSYVSFTSDGDDFTSMSNGGHSQIYRFTMENRLVEAVTLSSDGTSMGNGDSTYSAISPMGSNIAYASNATNLINTNSSCLFNTDTNGVRDVFLWESGSNPQRISMFRASGLCQEPELISDRPALADERANNHEAVFHTFSALPYDNFQDNNGELDVVAFDSPYNEHIYDTANNTPVIIIPTFVAPTAVPTVPPIIIPRDKSKAAAAPQATPQAPDAPSLDPDISADGNVIVYESFATNLIRNFVGNPADTNGLVDIYASVRDDDDSSWDVSRVSITSNNQATVGGDSRNPSVSMYGDHIAFQSKATNLDPAATTGNWQIFVRDRSASCTTLLSIHTDGTLGNGDSTDPSISANGRFIAFTSIANNLVDGDTNGYTDIFVIDRDANNTGSFYTDQENCLPAPSQTIRVSVAADGSQSDGPSYQPDMSLNSEFVAFTSDATSLVPDDLNGYSDIFVYYLGYTREIILEAPSQTPTPTPPTETFYFAYLPFIEAP